ncbi:hypothetical protein GRZ55_22475 [Chelativorans sp. ZYF759]|uniref:hypothetical protein n=1 Tax=Chelativorans sp. ZYF759 TaxID=2692213 RepID=UPI00145F7278|nr:hypothetical protein [Chelativorans sp. ZYF759]NMG41998.1 hypothetical protein [Chelativorans sp. ZYF759]
MKVERYELDGETVTLQVLRRRARDHAEMVAPPAAKDPVDAGLFGFAVVIGVLYIFLLLAGLDMQSFGRAMMLTAGLGFLGPYFYFRAAQKRHKRAETEHFLCLIERAQPLENENSRSNP